MYIIYRSVTTIVISILENNYKEQHFFFSEDTVIRCKKNNFQPNFIAVG